MSRNAKNKKRPDSHIASKQKYRQREWKRFRRFGLGLIIIAAIIGVGLTFYKSSYETSHNLEDLGKGTPVVVLIHNTENQESMRLRRNAKSALNQVDGELLLRVANTSTARGRSFQRQHDVPLATLLLFDARGRLRQTITDEQNTDVLLRAFNAHVKKWGKKV